MADGDFVLSADGHILEPIDLFKTRLPTHLRDRAVWEEDFELEEPLVEGGARQLPPAPHSGLRRVDDLPLPADQRAHPEGDPELILEDMALDGVDVQVMHPNLSLFGLYSDDHELSMAHARVYNDYIVERFSDYFDRLVFTAPDSAHRRRRRGGRDRARRRIGVPSDPAASHATAELLHARELDPVWDAAQANGVHPFFHTQTGGVKVADSEAVTLKVVLENAAQVNQPMTEKAAAKRMVTQGVYNTLVPQQLMCQLIGGGVPERYPDLHFCLIEFNAHWLASLLGGMDKCWVTGIGRRCRLVARKWDDGRPANDQPDMAQLFKLNEKWPHPLTPSEYVRRRVSRAVPGRPDSSCVPTPDGGVHHHLGKRLSARRRHLPRQPPVNCRAVRRRTR